jgi:hypothetical protein
MLTKLISPMVGAEHPGMGDAQWSDALRQISGQGQQAKGEASALLGQAGGGTVDPAAMASLARSIGVGQQSAMAKLAAHRAGLDKEARLGLGQILGPLIRMQQQGMQSYGDQLASLAGNIVGSGEYYGNKPYNIQAVTGTLPGLDAGHTMMNW